MNFQSIALQTLLIASATFANEPTVHTSIATAEKQKASSQSMETRVATLEQERAWRNWVKPPLSQEHSAFVRGDYLFWHTQEGGLAHAITTTQVPSDNPMRPTFQSQISDLDFNWDSAFRVGAGYRMAHDKWEMAVTWTHFVTTAKAETTLPGPTSAVTSLWVLYILPDTNPITSINARWDLHLNIADGEFARYYMATRNVSLKPHFGVRGAWIYQTYKTTINGGTFGGGPAVIFDTAKYKNNFRLVGLKAGVDTEWQFTRNWSLFGNIDGSLLYGTLFVERRDVLQTVIDAAPAPFVKSKNSSHDLIPTADLAAGLRFDYTFSNRWALSLQAGWEFNIFFFQNRLATSSVNSSAPLLVVKNESLTMQGLVISGRVDF